MRHFLLIQMGSFFLWSGCFGEPKQVYLSSSEPSKVCMDGGATLDLTTGQCACPGDLPWDGTRCEGTNPAAPAPSVSYDNQLDQDHIPEEHKAVYETLPPRDDHGSQVAKEAKPSNSANQTPTGDQSEASNAPKVEEKRPEVALKVEKKSETLTSVPTDKENKKIEIKSKDQEKLPSDSSRAEKPVVKVEEKKKDEVKKIVKEKEDQRKVEEGSSKTLALKKSNIQSEKPKGSSFRKYEEKSLPRNACFAARGIWSEKENYCLCPQGKVLIGKKCEDGKGRLTASGCREAVYPGRWSKDTCLCPEGKYFSMNRGGCVSQNEKKTPISIGTIKKVCENSLNMGLWDPRKGRCQCPGGSIWYGEECRAQSTLTSREVCTSEINNGQWNGATKRCVCPAGTLWIDQRCQTATAVSEISACESEINGGIWMTSSKSCRCGRGKKWDRFTKLCI